ncbi:hypothetical protein [Celeribacter sp.]|uniref:hypothetical protein n=1 Tax=Celeribacter sp. TaxID=1890673 RepID=UPI003A8FA355
MNGNLNGSMNGNHNGNTNGNSNGNVNANGNTNANVNGNTNSNTNTSDTTVTVDVDLGIKGIAPEDNDFIDLDHASMGDYINGSFDPGNELNMSELLDHALTGAGNDSGQIFGQSNNLVDNDTLNSPNVANNGGFTVNGTTSGGGSETGDGISSAGGSAAAEEADSGWGGHGKMGHGQGGEDADSGTGGGIGDWGSGNGDDGYVGGSAYSDAGAEMDVTAFNQSIVMGANVLGNTVDTTVVGGGMTSTYSIGDDEA